MDLNAKTIGYIFEIASSKKINKKRWIPLLNKGFTRLLKVTWHTAKYGDPYHMGNGDPCSAFTHPNGTHTQQWTHIHTHTHPEQWAVIYAAQSGEQLGVRCLAQGHFSRGIEGEESAVHSLPPTYNPCRPETRTRNLSITNPTLLLIRHYFPKGLIAINKK